MKKSYHEGMIKYSRHNRKCNVNAFATESSGACFPKKFLNVAIWCVLKYILIKNSENFHVFNKKNLYYCSYALARRVWVHTFPRDDSVHVN